MSKLPRENAVVKKTARPRDQSNHEIPGESGGRYRTYT
jgi:hypothetical protein